VFKKLVVGVDFTEKSDRAVKVALGLAGNVRGSVVLVSVVPSRAELIPTGQADDAVTGTLEHRLRDLAADLSKAHGLSIDYGVEVGEDPAAELNRFVDKWGGDVLVVGTSARTGLNRVLVGSIAERLFLHARVPVLVIGPAAAV